MVPVCICGGCGRTIEKKFVYCPWCGKSKVSFSSNDEHIEQVFRRLEEVQGQDKQNRIDEISKKLKSLEEELDILVQCSEMHK